MVTITNPSDGRRTRRPTWRLWAMTLAVFVSGLVIGAASTVFFFHQQRLRFRTPEAVHQKLLAEVRGTLQLDDAQVAAIAEVLKQRQQAFEALRAEMHPRLEREIALLESEIADVLPEDRREAWHVYYRKFRLEWMPPPPPPPALSGA